MKVAIYARYSSDNQSEKGIDDQINLTSKSFFKAFAIFKRVNKL